MVLLFLLSIAKVDKSYMKVVAFVWHMHSYVIFTLFFTCDSGTTKKFSIIMKIIYL